MKRYPNLDILRLFLALDVVLHHVWVIIGHRTYNDMAFAVPTFVALSGFLIPDSLARSKSLAHFGWKRALRVYPAMLVSLALVVGLFGIQRLGPTLITYFTLGLVPVVLGANGALWSLSLEECLYAFHAFTRRAGLYAPSFLLLLIFTGAILELRQPPGEVTRLIDACSAFFLGCVLCIYKEKVSRVHWAAPLALGVGLLVLINARLPLSAGFFVGRCAISGCLVVFAYRLPQWNWKMPDLSYSIYVYHVPLMVLVMGWNLALLPSLLATMGLTLGVGYLSYRFIETPALTRKDRLPHFSLGLMRDRFMKVGRLHVAGVGASTAGVLHKDLGAVQLHPAVAAVAGELDAFALKQVVEDVQGNDERDRLPVGNDEIGGI